MMFRIWRCTDAKEEKVYGREPHTFEVEAYKTPKEAVVMLREGGEVRPKQPALIATPVEKEEDDIGREGYVRTRPGKRQLVIWYEPCDRYHDHYAHPLYFEPLDYPADIYIATVRHATSPDVQRIHQVASKTYEKDWTDVSGVGPATHESIQNAIQDLGLSSRIDVIKNFPTIKSRVKGMGPAKAKRCLRSLYLASWHEHMTDKEAVKLEIEADDRGLDSKDAILSSSLTPDHMT